MCPELATFVLNCWPLVNHFWCSSVALCRPTGPTWRWCWARGSGSWALGAAPEAESDGFETARWLKTAKRKAGNGKERAQHQNGKTSKRRSGNTENDRNRRDKQRNDKHNAIITITIQYTCLNHNSKTPPEVKRNNKKLITITNNTKTNTQEQSHAYVCFSAYITNTSWGRTCRTSWTATATGPPSCRAIAEQHK